MATMLDLALKVSLLMIVTGALIAMMRRTSSASRHVALTAALSAAVLLPAARWTLPTLPLFVLAPESDSRPSTVLSPAAVVSAAPRTFADPSSASTSSLAAGSQPATAPSLPVALCPLPCESSVPASREPWSWASVIPIVWLIGTAAILIRMLVAGIRIRMMARHAQPVDDARMTARLGEIKKQFGVRRPIAVVVSAREWMPVTWGFVRPTILLPSCAPTWIDAHAARLDAVLVHEMAHIARWDVAWQGIARVAVAIFWFNPLVWIAARRARLERERACDDAVLARGLRATDYASDLILLAQTLVLPSRAAGSALAMARRSQLEQRVGALLDDRVSRCRASRVSRLLAIAIIVLMLPMSAAQLAARPLAASEPSLDRNEPTTVGPAQPSLAQLPLPTIASPLTDPGQPVTAPAIDGASVSTPGREAAPSIDAAANPTFDTPLALAPLTPTQSASLVSQEAKWKLERDAMLRLLAERARNLVKDGRTKMAIGTVAPVDMKPLEDALALVERSAAAVGRHCAMPDPFATSGGGTCVNGFWRAATTSFIAVNLPTDAEIAALKTRFTEAIRNLDVAEVRWDNGLATTAEIAAVLQTALQAVTEGPGHTPMPIRFVTRSGTNGLSDAALLQLLKDVASIKDDAERANILLDLAARHAFTPDMVALYVAAAKGIASAAEQARVFAQPIRVK